MSRRKRVLIGMVKRRLEELEWTHKWVGASPEMMMDLIMEARDRGSLLHVIPASGWLRITDKRYGAVVLKHEGSLEGKSFVIRKGP